MTESIAELLDALDLRVVVLSGPEYEIEESSRTFGPHRYPRLRYEVSLRRGDSVVLDVPFFLGVGHVRLRWHTVGAMLSREESDFLRSWRANPHARFTDVHLWGRVAVKLARAQRVAPIREDVIYCLLMDGSPCFDDSTFEDWCADLGYDSDSRSAHETYMTCLNRGQRMVRALGRDDVDRLREAFQDY